ncbi:DUF1501 domain-containing protein [Tundrisphaera sp. TA3]|uniref:DUF1501 domain-containing protein n=1 Tax=Tundrisphaera sp. TA3 TaxID=3435775 RepID=UPI003EBF9E53
MTPPNRRHFLRTLSAGVGGLGLASFLHADGVLGADGSIPAPHFPAKARRVILLFMGGGPSHLDMLDPKPMIQQYAGQRPDGVALRTERVTGGLLPSPFAFEKCGESGIEVSELLPHLKQRVDDLCVLRGVHGSNPNHGPATNFMISGRIDMVHPTIGSWVSYGLGTENRSLPSFISLGNYFNVARNGYLPGQHQGTPVDVGQDSPDKMIRHLRNPRIDRDRQARQLDLLRAMNADHLAERPEDALLEARVQAMETAFRMQAAAPEVFDIRKESAETRKLYGEGRFADTCLLARRLSENGVRFVQVVNSGWDHHDKINKNIREKCKEIDQPIAGLIADLKARGMLEDTLVIWGGEFGRTPVSEGGDGRDHNPFGFTMWMAGGGVKAGHVHGATDDFGFRSVDGRVGVHDLHATILHLLGLDHERLTYRYSGRDFRLTDVEGTIVRDILA